MNRQNVGESWFDKDAAEKFEEDSFFDGRNNISRATNDQFVHERLYRTRKGRWVLHRWSQWQGSREFWKFVSDETAQAWLLAQGHTDAVSPEYLAAQEV